MYTLYFLFRYCHPYLHELNAFKVPPSQLENVKPAVPLELGTTCPIFVDNEEMLNDMMVVLKNAKELAVDLEVSRVFFLLPLTEIT